MQFQISSLSDIGKLRKKNEDSFLEFDFEDESNTGVLLVVADGMGGHRGGEVASKTVVESIENFFKSNELDPSRNSLETLKQSIAHANEKVFKVSSDNKELKGMGSTCTAIIIKNNETLVAHVGDSSAYLVRDQNIKKLTRDHTMAEKMIESGVISEEEAKSSPHKNMLVKAIGIAESIEVETYEPIKTISGDAYVLCSDGLTEYLGEDEICSIINLYEPEEACNLLVNIANKRGGKDNITVQIAKIMNSEPVKKKGFMDSLKKLNPFKLKG